MFFFLYQIPVLWCPVLQSCLPWMTLTTPSGNPASLTSSISIIQAPGSRSEGFIKLVLPVTRAMGNIYKYYMYIDVSTLSTVYSAITAWSHLNVIHQQREYVQKFVIQLIFIWFIKKIGDNTEIDKHIKTQGILYCKVFISTQALGWELHAMYHICSTIQSNATKIEKLIYPLPTEESWQGSWMGWFQQWPREEHGKS